MSCSEQVAVKPHLENEAVRLLMWHPPFLHLLARHGGSQFV